MTKLSPRGRCRIRRFFVLLCACLLSGISISLAEAPNIKVNPLLTYREQIKSLIKECRGMGESEACRTQIEALEREERALKKHCEKNSHDFRCDAIRRNKKEFIDPLEELCAVNPHHNKCTQRREIKSKLAKRKIAYCKRNPESSRCLPRPPPKAKEPYLDRHCKTHAHQKRCVKHAAAKRRQTDPNYEKDRANAF